MSFSRENVRSTVLFIFQTTKTFSFRPTTDFSRSIEKLQVDSSFDRSKRKLARQLIHVCLTTVSDCHQLIKKTIHQFFVVPRLDLLIFRWDKPSIVHLKSLDHTLSKSRISIDSTILETKEANLCSIDCATSILAVSVKHRLLLYSLSSRGKLPHYDLIRRINIRHPLTYLSFMQLQFDSNDSGPVLFYSFASTCFTYRIDQDSGIRVLHQEKNDFNESNLESPMRILRVVPIPSSLTNQRRKSQ